MTASQAYVDTLVDAVDQQAIELEQYYAELGHGQQEISTGHAPALRAADEQLLVRETIRGVAAQHGLVASLAPKPWPEAAGNGGHLHFSLWEGERNRFHDPSAEDRLSSQARSFVAGVLEHLAGLCGLTAPSFNSYRRIVPQSWAGAFTCWGHDNREAPLRVPFVFSGREEATTNVELKAADGTCNPYLALGGLIAAGLDGLERGLDPPEPVEVDPAVIADEERARRGIRRLPATQEEALNALEADEVLMDALPEALARSYLAVRRSEWATYSAGDEEFEQQGHFLKY
jgi:glutamine synthetase